MRTTLALDDELVTKAQAWPGLKEKSRLIREALKALIEREAARRLARLGGAAANPILSPCGGGQRTRDPGRCFRLGRPSAFPRQNPRRSSREGWGSGASLRDRRTC